MLTVYAFLDPWQLRQQSHLEEPWRVANDLGGRHEIEQSAIREHFVGKFRRDVRLPEYLGRASSFAIDGVPTAGFSTLRELAAAIRKKLG